jgi:hypothetical protein
MKSLLENLLGRQRRKRNSTCKGTEVLVVWFGMLSEQQGTEYCLDHWDRELWSRLDRQYCYGYMKQYHTFK